MNRIGLLLLAFFTASSSTFKVDQNELIRQKIEMIQSEIAVTIKGDPIYCKTALPQFYITKQFKKVWNEEKASELIQVLEKAQEEGQQKPDTGRG